MRKTSLLFLIFIAILLSGCASEPPFQQTVENITKIELVSNDYIGPMYNCTFTSNVLCTLTEDDTAAFMEDLLKLECSKRHPPVGYIGIYEVRIYYDNGDIDIIGSDANGYTEQGEIVVSGWYRYSEEDLQGLFEKYATLSQESAA